jgi:multidrug resistance efflux pump
MFDSKEKTPPMKRALRFVVLLVIVGSIAGYYVWRSRETTLVLTGIVTTDDVVVSPQISGQIDQLLVKEGDQVAKGGLIAVLAPEELRADRAYYERSAQSAAASVAGSEATLRYEEQQTEGHVDQAQAALASAEQAHASGAADLERARLTYERNQRLLKAGVVSTDEFDQSRTAYEALTAHVAALAKDVDSAKAALALARASAEQVRVRREQLSANRYQAEAAGAARAKADVRLGYADIHAPIDGIVDVRAARQGEVVAAGQPIVTLINPDDLWVRADVEETYIDRVRPGDHLTVRLPSGAERDGVVFYRAADAGFATARDVSRTKRDIRTFEIRLRVDNRDRRLAVGMTASVLLPIG